MRGYPEVQSDDTGLQVLECIKPGSDDIVLPKTSSNVFSSTNVDYILRSLEKRYLILAGCVTDQCVESAVREACDRHYYVTLVTGKTCQVTAIEQIKPRCGVLTLSKCVLCRCMRNIHSGAARQLAAGHQGVLPAAHTRRAEDRT